MARVNREGLLRVLEMVTPGLSVRETIAQSSCLVFSEGKVMTFNEEILAVQNSPLPELNGAVKASPLLDLLSKLSDDTDLEVEQHGSELRIKGSGRKSGIRMEEEVMLPVQSVEMPEVWRKLDEKFLDAVNIVSPCASTEEAKFLLTCVHIHPEYIEACDRYQIARCPVNTGVEESILVRAESIKRVLGYDMVDVSETASWIHFRNQHGLVLSIRRFLDDYPDLSNYLSLTNTEPITLPGAMEEVVGRAEVFSREKKVGSYVIVDLRNDFVVIEGEGAAGWYKERKPVVYNGAPIMFQIPPQLLVSITKRSLECRVGDGKLCVDGGTFLYSTCTIKKDRPAQNV